MGLVKVNPCAKIDLPRSPCEEQVFLTAEEVRDLAEAIDPFYRVLVYTAAYTGLQAGELLALRRQDVNLLRGTLSVRRSLKDVSGRLEVGPVKTAYSERTMSLPGFLRKMLGEHLSLATGGNGADALVFPSKTGLPLRYNLFYRRHFRPGSRTRASAREARVAVPRSAAHLRFASHRGRSSPEADLRASRAQLNPDHARPLLAPVAERRGGFGRGSGRDLRGWGASGGAGTCRERRDVGRREQWRLVMARLWVV